MAELRSAGQHTCSVSVVIPTLGGETLAGTIEQLNRGTIEPSEILVCIPEEDADRVKGLSFPNVRVIKTGCRGQVAQRAIGFQHAREPMVLQLDDDILLHEEALQELAAALRRCGQGNVLAPVYYDSVTKRCFHELSDGLLGWLKSLNAYVVYGAPWGVKRMGVVTAIGANYGVDISHCDGKPFETQWIPGGCVLCFREDLIKENFFPFTGKAYCEDLIHSFLRTENGLRLWVIPTAQCFIDGQDFKLSRSLNQAEINARRHYAGLRGGAKWRLMIHNIFSRLKKVVSYKNTGTKKK